MILIKCPHCQSDNPEAAQYCAECGIKIEHPKETGPNQAKPAGPSHEALAVGSTFAQRYEITAELGQGSLGKIYKAIDKSLDRDVVLKLIKPEIAQYKKSLELFSVDMRAARKIVHKNVARMLDFNEAEGLSYIMMEYVAGQDLKAVITESGRLRTEKAVAIAIQVSEGLAQAHQLGIVHGDLKPSNIMIDKDGIAKILNFGVAGSVYAKGISDAAGIILSPEYMSPERVEGKDIDPRSDIYSLGIILFKMVTGHVPFEGDDPTTIARRHSAEIPKIPDELGPVIPPGLSRLILKCLEKDKEKRYQTAEDLRSDLDNIGRPLLPAEQAESVKSKERPVSPQKIVAAKEAKREAAPQTKKEEKKERKKEKPGKPALEFNFRKMLVPALVSLAVIVFGVVIWQFILKPSKGAFTGPAVAAKRSVAVLAFEDLSPAKEHQYLGDGMAEAVIDSLANIDGLWVPASTSSFSLRGTSLTETGIGQSLGVEHILKTNFQVIQDKLLVTAKLVRVKNGATVWSNQYSRSTADIFPIMEEIVQGLLKSLEVKLSPEKESSLMAGSVKNPEAYDLYLQGRFLRNKGGKENLGKAIEFFEKAGEKDSALALAYCGLADAYTILASNFNWPTQQTFLKARLAVIKALELDPNLAEAHTLLGVIKANFDWDFAGAERAYKEAIRLRPNSVPAHQWYAVFLSNQGRHEEAIAEIKNCRALDPLSPGISANVGALLYFARRYDQAVEELNASLRAHPSYFVNYYYLGLVDIQMEQNGEAIKAFEKAKLLGGEPLDMNLRIAYVYALQGGLRQEVGKILAEAIKASSQGYFSQVSIATVYAALGEKDQVMACLEKALGERDVKLVFLKVHPMFDRVRRDPRYLSLMRQIGLEK